MGAKPVARSLFAMRPLMVFSNASVYVEVVEGKNECSYS
jgi:hypothetical protein